MSTPDRQCTRQVGKRWTLFASLNSQSGGNKVIRTSDNCNSSAVSTTSVATVLNISGCLNPCTPQTNTSYALCCWRLCWPSQRFVLQHVESRDVARTSYQVHGLRTPSLFFSGYTSWSYWPIIGGAVRCTCLGGPSGRRTVCFI
jgi:hypothetical protein